MKLLFILPYIPYPLDSGGNQATYNMIDKIREKYDVSILLFVGSAKDEESVAALQTRWGNVTFYLCPLNEDKSVNVCIPNDECPDTFSYRILDYFSHSIERKKRRRIRKHMAERQVSDDGVLTAKEPVDFVRNNSCLNKEVFDVPLKMQEYVYQVSRMGFDVIQVEFYECLPFVYLLPEKVVKVFVQHEIRYVRNENELSLFAECRPNDEFRLQMKKDQEIMALSRFDVVVALTEVDKQLMLRECPNLNVYVSPAVISLPEVSHVAFRPARELVFVGSGAHFPNADGLLWFCREVMPVLAKKAVDVKLNVVGVWNEEIRGLLMKYCPKINFTGFIDDLWGFLAGKISVVPIRIGSGMRMKILDSIVSYSPVVTTSKGCEGLPLADGENCFIADSPEEFASAIERLVGDNEKQQNFAERLYTDFYEVFKIEELVEKRMNLYKSLE